MVAIPSPQALGAFPFPAGLLLIPGDEHSDLRQNLLNGRAPDEWPADLKGQRLVWEGDLDGAAQVFAESDEPLDAYNLFLLDPERVSRQQAATALPEDYQPLVDYVAFAVGLTNVPPSDTSALPEVSALAKTALAAAHLDDGNRGAAVAILRDAAAQLEDHPALQGLVLSEIAGHGGQVEEADRAIAILKDTDFAEGLAEAKYHRAGLIHGLAMEGRRPMSEAIIGYTDALNGLNETDHRALYARLHLNLGTAYLAAPMASASDGMRAGMAISSLRTAARFLDPLQEEQEYTSALLNLANALVYAPSGKRRDNLMEAVDLYEQVLPYRPMSLDPLGRARVLSNQGNALAHLGFLGDAQVKLQEAREIFAGAGDETSASVVSDLLTSLRRGEVWAGELEDE